MSTSALLRTAMVAIPVALCCGGAVAQQVVTVPNGFLVVLVPRVANTPGVIETREFMPAAPTDAWMQRIFAEQRVMMDRMTAEMDAMFRSGPNPMSSVSIAMDGSGIPAIPAGAGTFCQESVTIAYNGGDSKPVVHVSRSGTGCGPETAVAQGSARVVPLPAPKNALEIDAPATEPRVQHRT